MRTAKCSGRRKSSNWLIFRSSARRIVGHDAPHLVGEVHRDRRKDVMPGAVFEQQVHDHALRIRRRAVPAGRPANRSELVIVAVPDRIDSGVEEPSHHVDVSGRGGPGQRRRVIAFFERVDVEPAIEQQVDDVEMAVLCRMMQQRPLVGLIANVERIRIPIQRSCESRDVVGPGGFKEFLVHVASWLSVFSSYS